MDSLILTKSEARKQGYKALTNYYDTTSNEQKMMLAVIADQVRNNTPYCLVKNGDKTAVWRKGIMRFREFKLQHASHIVESKRSQTLARRHA